MSTIDKEPRPPSRQQDAALVNRLAQHDEEAFRFLIESCGGFVYGRALQILQEPRLAEEVTQDTLLVLWWDPAKFDPARSSVRTFLVAIARYKSIDVVRQRNVMRGKETLLRDADSFMQDPPVDEEVEDCVIVREAISRLPVGKREVIFLAFYRGLTYGQVATALDLPEGTVKTRIRDALTWLGATIGSRETTCRVRHQLARPE